MQGVHPMADLAPRDVVARAIVARMAATGSDHVCSTPGTSAREFLERRFPSIVARCRELGFDPATELLPVAPAQHYASGGVQPTCSAGPPSRGSTPAVRSSCTGVHGANRLASNSLLEGLVFAARIADDITARLAAGELPPTTAPAAPGAAHARRAPGRRIQRAMTAGAGAVRSAAPSPRRRRAGRLAAEAARAARRRRRDRLPGPQSWETPTCCTSASC